MPVGDYVHSKDTGQHHRPITGDRSNSRLSRQFLAEQAKVSVPATKLTGFPPPNTAPDGQTKLEYRAPPPSTGVQQQQQPQPQQAAQNNEGAASYRDPFDTDVEGVDDSTIAGTSVIEAEDSQVQEPAYPNAYLYEGANARWIKRQHSIKSEGLGDKAMKAAGFDSDDADAEEARTVSSLHDDDDDGDDEDDGGANGEETQVLRWQSSQEHHHRLADASMSTRLENHFWATSQKQYKKSQNLPLNGMSPSSKRVVALQTPYKNGLLGTTPRTRFTRQQSILDRLQISPTRGASGPRPQPERSGSKANHKQRKSEDEDMAGFDSNDGNLKSAGPSAFDNTDVENIDDTENLDNQYLSSSRETSKSSSVPPEKEKDKKMETEKAAPSKKRQFESDYPQEILTQKPFSDLESEPFDFVPTSTPPAQDKRPSPSPKEAKTAAERVSLLMKLSDQERREYLSTLTIDEWEECGDELMERFTAMLTKMKETRHARRRTAAIFEAEIKRRHEQVQEQHAELVKKLADMREGGLGVLRGLTP